MKVVIPGGTGQVGTILNRALTAAGHEVVVLTRHPTRDHEIRWDGETLGPWAEEIDGSDLVINLAGRSVSCRYTQANLRAMMDSRVLSTRVVGEAIAAAGQPPRLWLQMSTATVYAHRFDAPNDEATGLIGGTEPGVPDYWAYSVEIAKAWERTQEQAETPHTRKVALRSAMVMSPDRGGAFDVLLRLARLGLGGPVAGGAQYVSWIHDHDFVRAVEFLAARDDLAGPVNLAAPTPLPQRTFMRALRTAWGIPVGLPATKWMAELGAFALRSDTELLLKSRRVTPGRLLEAGFTFAHPQWPEAAADLTRRKHDAPTPTTKKPSRREGGDLRPRQDSNLRPSA
ncbi:TIGR01777 family oxidoreductase [Streptomyces sp. NBC_00038]|uniref:TIGR01777 family oxidoreductase n=1 Tax=Streptomyces sp. NBC_00038 TaxID=2903615 RepID=UPI00225876CC|nr:TIGR01777 family oxidoreductase [Streptomyces sp. NBC_00038]MCX5557783.1 TIGR01777 family oxidoreductase [Streptomyces sp. NBC_00038]